ncbi:MAG: outer membrane lipoprotein carrier protein LolA [Bacteroidales bacterium]|nr:outer membrane lipoprotein carrier protein LolA [Bacteroidales bacterium]
MHKLLLILSLMIFHVAGAQNKPLDAIAIQRIKQNVLQTAKTTSTISSDFIQEKEMSILNDKIITSGKFYFKKERSLRWEYLHPFSYVITLRGDLISVNDEGVVKSFNTQSNKVFSEVNRIIIGSVNGTLLDDDSFIALYSQNKDYYIVSLTPLSATLKENLEKIVLFFDKTDHTVDQLEMFESTGDFTRITFIKKQLNQPIPDEVFILR